MPHAERRKGKESSVELEASCAFRVCELVFEGSMTLVYVKVYLCSLG